MTMQLSKRNGMKNKVMWLNIKCFFFLFVIVFFIGSMELRAEDAEAGNPGVERVELEMQPGMDYAVLVWQAQPGIDDWVFNYHYVYHENPAHMLNVMEYGKNGMDSKWGC